MLDVSFKFDTDSTIERENGRDFGDSEFRWNFITSSFFNQVLDDNIFDRWEIFLPINQEVFNFQTSIVIRFIIMFIFIVMIIVENNSFDCSIDKIGSGANSDKIIIHQKVSANNGFQVR